MGRGNGNPLNSLGKSKTPLQKHIYINVYKQKKSEVIQVFMYYRSEV